MRCSRILTWKGAWSPRLVLLLLGNHRLVLEEHVVNGAGDVYGEHRPRVHGLWDGLLPCAEQAFQGFPGGVIHKSVSVYKGVV